MKNSARLQLILGGAKSGKSHFALHQGNEDGFDPKTFLATASADDQEMKQRIERHKMQRGPEWHTLEEPYFLADSLRKNAVHPKGLVIVDCATLWISNLLCGKGGKVLTDPEIEKEFETLLKILPGTKGRVRFVSNEVGGGIVPDNALARRFRDLQGQLNLSLAGIADQVVLMTAGLPQKIK